MTIVIAHKADATGAQRLWLTIKHMNARALLNQHNFMEIMMMLREGGLGYAGFNRNGVIAFGKKSALCNMVMVISRCLTKP